MIRGDVYWAVLDPTEGSEQAGTRPVIIVSRDALNRNSPIVVVVPLTDRKNKGTLYPSHAEIKCGEGGVAMDSVALCEQVRSVSKGRLKNQIGHLPAPRMADVITALKITLDL